MIGCVFTQKTYPFIYINLQTSTADALLYFPWNINRDNRQKKGHPLKGHPGEKENIYGYV